MINHTNAWQLFAETVNHIQAYQTLLEAGDQIKLLESYEELRDGYFDYLFEHKRSPFYDQAPEEDDVDEGYDSGETEAGVPYNPEESQRILAMLWKSEDGEYELLTGAYEGGVVEVNLIRAGMPVGTASMSFGTYHTPEEFAAIAGFEPDEDEDAGLDNVGSDLL